MKRPEVIHIEIKLHVGPRGFFPSLLDTAWFVAKAFGYILFFLVFCYFILFEFSIWLR